MDQLNKTLEWFQLAVPKPTDKNKSVQLGVCMEEFSELLTAQGCTLTASMVSGLAEEYKQGLQYIEDSPEKRIETLDALCDIIVTAVGVAHMLGMDIIGAMQEVNRSNFSKFVDGKPVFNAQGKIAKPDTYSAPNLKEFI